MSVNKVILLGNVGKEPDVKYFEAGKGVANFTLATTERAHKVNSEHIVQEHTEWHNIVVRGGLVQVVEKYVHKGTKLYIEGRIRSRTYVDKENQSRFVTEIAVDTLEILSRREPSGYQGSESMSSLGEPTADYDKHIEGNFSSPF